MHPAVATLEMAARQLQLSGELERSEFGRIMMQLRSVADGLSTVDRRIAKQKAASVNFTAMLRSLIAPAAPACGPGDGARLPMQEMMVEGPPHDLRDLLCSLVEYARAVGTEPLDWRAQIKQDIGAARAKRALRRRSCRARWGCRATAEMGQRSQDEIDTDTAAFLLPAGRKPRTRLLPALLLLA